MSEQNQETNQQRYVLENGFFILSDGTRVPAISLRNIWSQIHKSYVELNYLYSLKTQNFIKGTIIYNDDNEDNDGYNIGIRYRLSLGDYIWFKTKIYRNSKAIDVEVCDAYLRIDDPEALMRDEYASYVEKRECVNSLIYYEQISKIVTDNLVIKKLLDIAKSYIETEKDDFEIPEINSSVNYTWRDFKQDILYLRQPYDMFA
ncbi:hypothetical protein SSRV2_ORF9 [Saccharolobus shibatae rod virus 2]|nr:hypothetical protein [Saccharolobus shibatae filamentous virus 3]WHA35184.1 hypothetical protein SSRV2_ORF9 [Saccharolobus shibatae rod virus 2]